MQYPGVYPKLHLFKSCCLLSRYLLLPLHGSISLNCSFTPDVCDMGTNGWGMAQGLTRLNWIYIIYRYSIQYIYKYGTYTIRDSKGSPRGPPGEVNCKTGGFFRVSFSPLSERSMMYLHSTIRRDSKWSSWGKFRNSFSSLFPAYLLSPFSISPSVSS